MLLELLRERFASALTKVAARYPDTASAMTPEEVRGFATMVRPAADPRFGDYQANCAMPLAKRLAAAPRDVAAALVEELDWKGISSPPAIAGPGFINLRLTDELLAETAAKHLQDPRLGVEPAARPLTILIDYSSPNVAKPMHVGHIRSTVIGDALAKIFRFLGHRVITDNHLGDWGTQFGMVIYGFKHFGDEGALARNPVGELSRLYRLVNRMIEYHEATAALPGARAAAEAAAAEPQAAQQDTSAGGGSATESSGKQAKKREKAVAAARKKAEAAAERVRKLEQTLASAAEDKEFVRLAEGHREIAAAVLEETVRLHEGDTENVALWNRFLPYCRDEIDRIYARLGISFDHTLGESFYHDMLGDVVERLRAAGLAKPSEGAECVFLPEFDAPMIVRKRDGAYLYATTDLATLFYRREHFAPDEILYVVDTRQSEHFEKLFAVARALAFDMRLVHVNFGTVLGSDGRPFKTRSGSSVGLESLLDEAVAKASAVVCDPQRSAKLDPPLSEDEKREIADAVGHGAIKYADLSHHRTSDYRFDLEKMVSLDGNTSAYVQYAYARARGILQKGGADLNRIASSAAAPRLQHEAERALVLSLLRFGESLEQVRGDYAPNFLVDYLYDTAKSFSVFNDNCPVLRAEDDIARQSRLMLVALAARVLETGLGLLGIKIVPRM